MIETIFTENFNNVIKPTYVTFKLCVLSVGFSMCNIAGLIYCLLVHKYFYALIWILVKLLYWHQQIKKNKCDIFFCIFNDVVMILMHFIRLMELHNTGVKITVYIRLKLCYIFGDKIMFVTYPFSLKYMLCTDYKIHQNNDFKHFLTIKPHISYLQKYQNKYIKKYEIQQQIKKESIENKLTKKINKNLELAKICEIFLKSMKQEIKSIDIILKGSTSVLLRSMHELLWQPSDLDCDLLCTNDIAFQDIRNMTQTFHVFIDQVYEVLPETVKVNNKEYKKTSGKRVKLAYTHISGLCCNFYGKKYNLYIYCLMHLSLPQFFQKYKCGKWALFNLMRIKGIYVSKENEYYYPEILDISTLYKNDPKYMEYANVLNDGKYYIKDIIYYPTVSKYVKEMLRMIKSPRGTNKEPEYWNRIQLSKDYHKIMFLIMCYLNH